MMEANEGGAHGKAPRNGVLAKTRGTRSGCLTTTTSTPTHSANETLPIFAGMAVSIFQRKRDLIYLVFFIVHLPVMLGKSRNTDV